jgi:hypothetical protein
MRVRFMADAEDPAFAVGFQNSRRDTIFATSSALDDPHPGWYRAGEEVVVRFAFDNVLASDRYSATPAVVHPGSGQDFLDWRERLVTVVVTATRSTGALVELPVQIEVERSATAEVPR